MEPDFAALRREFPLLQHTTYLNSGSYCALANSVKDAFDRYLQDRLEVGANWDVWVTKNDAVRSLMAQLLRASPDEIAVTASASAGLNAIATALQFTGGRDKVVISDFEFPTNAQIWHGQEPRGARVVHVPRDATGYIPPEAFASHIDEQTKLVAITHVCFRNGARLDIPAIVRLARAKGALVLLDCYQSVGSVDIDVKALDVDFAVGGMLKYLLGTAGIGFLYVRDSLVRALHPTHTGWFAQENIFAMDITANRPASTARRFEAGTPPVVSCYASEAGLKILLGVGTPAIDRRVRALTRRCMEQLRGIGWASVTPEHDERHGAMVCVPSRASTELSQELMKRKIVTSNRDNNLRICLHFYNDDEDVDVLVEALRELRGQYAI